MEDTRKCYVVDFYLDGDYLNSKCLFQEHKIEVGQVISVEIPKSQANVTGKVVDTLDMSDDEYHLYVTSV